MLDFESIIQIPTPIITLKAPIFEKYGVEVWLKRDELTHPFISGNKFRKLKYNLMDAQERGIKNLLTFGGAYSNHLSAFSYACKAFGFDGKVLVRGEELNKNSSPTLQFAAENGLELVFVSRSDYRDKDLLVKEYGEEHYIIPEGGSSALALKGVAELMLELPKCDFVITACGTGGTFAGLVQAAPLTTQIIGVSVLKGGDFLREDVAKMLGKTPDAPHEIWLDYHWGGYAKYTPELIAFMEERETEFGIELEQVYTAKMFWAFYQKLKEGYFPRGSKVVLIHTGGLQGRIKKEG